MTNRDLEAAWSYHDGTKHSYASIRTNPHYLDWENQPIPFKIYSSLEPVALPHDHQSSRMRALSAISSTPSPSAARSVPDLRTLARVLYLSAGVTKRITTPGGEMYFRAAACTGALYHIDLYLVSGNLPGVEAGVYHFGPHDFALRKLRAGDYRSILAHASGGEPSIVGAPDVIICTSTFWRNAWKYQARTYRHCFWDCGTILANMLAAAAAYDLPARIILGFVDEEVNRLLDLDTNREVALALVSLGHDTDVRAEPMPSLEPLKLETTQLSRHEDDYPAIRKMHSASSLTSAEEVKAWRGATPSVPKQAIEGQLYGLQPLKNEQIPQEPIESVIIRRGSPRRLARVSITFTQLSTMLDRATEGIPADFLDPVGATMIDLYLIVNAVEGVPTGAYVFRREEAALELLREGDFRQNAGYLGLEQELPADASVAIYMMTDLKPVLDRFGNRGYRAAQLEASIIGGKLYLAAPALKLGGTGLTFYDDEVTEFFSPHAAGKSVMFHLAAGKRKSKKAFA